MLFFDVNLDHKAKAYSSAQSKLAQACLATCFILVTYYRITYLQNGSAYKSLFGRPDRSCWQFRII